MNALTQRQQQVLDCIRDYIAEHGYAPSNRDIGKAVGISSPNGVQQHLKALENKGRLRRTPGVARSLRVVD